MSDSILTLRKTAITELKSIEKVEELESFRLKYLVKKGPIQTLLRELSGLEPNERKARGELVNKLRDDLENLFALRKSELRARHLAEKESKEEIDVTLPSRRQRLGSYHPVTQVLNRMLEIMQEMGFSVHEGCNVDDDYHNFASLNFPDDHPARDTQDTFYLEKGALLRTQTSNMQVRLMKKFGAPLRVASGGRCFRNETITSRSHVIFHQVEGLYIDENVNMGDLLSTLERFYRAFFKADVSIRVRPSYFPFVEPGVEVDVSCAMCSQKGCSMCKHSGWLELAGAGMVHPHVLQEGGLNPERYSGFAWGMGVDRLVLTLLGVPDIRLLTQNDMRFLSQFL